jgi:hypothetical protein
MGAKLYRESDTREEMIGSTQRRHAPLQAELSKPEFMVTILMATMADISCYSPLG